MATPAMMARACASAGRRGAGRGAGRPHPLAPAAGRGGRRLRLLGWLSIALIGATMAAMITLAANAALAANAEVIRVLRLVGAQGQLHRPRLRAPLHPARAGGGRRAQLAGLAGVALLPAADAAGGFLTGLGFTGLGWLWPFVLPPLAGLVAFAATRRAAFAN
jgi:cell division transport system permease protein